MIRNCPFACETTLRTESPSIFLDKSTHLGKIEATLLAGYCETGYSLLLNWMSGEGGSLSIGVSKKKMKKKRSISLYLIRLNAGNVSARMLLFSWWKLRWGLVNYWRNTAWPFSSQPLSTNNGSFLNGLAHWDLKQIKGRLKNYDFD